MVQQTAMAPTPPGSRTWGAARRIALSLSFPRPPLPSAKSTGIMHGRSVTGALGTNRDQGHEKKDASSNPLLSSGGFCCS